MQKIQTSSAKLVRKREALLKKIAETGSIARGSPVIHSAEIRQRIN